MHLRVFHHRFSAKVLVGKRLQALEFSFVSFLLSVITSSHRLYADRQTSSQPLVNDRALLILLCFFFLVLLFSSISSIVASQVLCTHVHRRKKERKKLLENIFCVNIPSVASGRNESRIATLLLPLDHPSTFLRPYGAALSCSPCYLPLILFIFHNFLLLVRSKRVAREGEERKGRPGRRTHLSPKSCRLCF